MTRAAVLGAGSWGTTFAKVLADAGCDVTLYARRPELAKAITEDGENRDYLPGIRLPHAVRATADPAEALIDASIVVLAVPSQSLRDNLTDWSPLLPSDATLLSLMKGIELGTTKRMSEVICEVTGAGADRVAALSGLNLAREIAEEQPAATVIACTDTARATRCRRPATRATSGRTRTPTSSGASSAARSRTSSPWPAASRKASASATTPAPR